ncbi:hypothetical protein NLM31_12980 [Bradyrhizobium sp. CCGUVB4N]|uniref:hypothetical protein n=1 Tax=Bradyrhizobium sp. CCGUVB4N TaxID=2949631 RepID=UPI0020B2BF0C|nr:hypothetical protein [Bradyrhizobium sp. CCGUVB4N]MCP3381254.1 hypothetical protein [Bradyrhizobium sp. CCGUVB4N]
MSNNQPVFVAYSVKERLGKQPIWRKIGVAFAHTKKPGFNIELAALPIGDRIVLLEPKEDKPESETDADKGGAQ